MPETLSLRGPQNFMGLALGKQLGSCGKGQEKPL